MMNERGKSDRPIVPGKSLNKAGQPAAEEMEGRGLTKGNPQQQNASRTLSRNDAPSALERIRQAASKDKEMRFGKFLQLGFVKGAAGVRGGLMDGVDGEILKCAAVLHGCSPWAGWDVRGGWSGTA